MHRPCAAFAVTAALALCVLAAPEARAGGAEIRKAVKAAKDAVSADDSDRLAGALAMYPDAMCLYLQERRAPATTARQAISDLASDLDGRAMALSQVAADQKLVVVSDPRVSALAVLGAVEALALAAVRNQVQMDPVETTKGLISIVLEGLRK